MLYCVATEQERERIFVQTVTVIHRPGSRQSSMFWAFLTVTVAMVTFALKAGAQETPNTLWQRQSIYQIITDRFFDGDPSNDNADDNYDPAGHRGTSVHGGDFKGIEDKLDYIKSLGATAIWI